MRTLLGILFAVQAFAGQSLRTSTTYAANTSFPAQAHSLPVRVEFYLHDWAAHPSGAYAIVKADSIGFTAYFNGSANATLSMYNQFDTGPYGGSAPCNISLSGLPTQGAYIRYQRDPDPTIKTNYCEAWDTTGNRFYSNTYTYAADTPNFVSAGVQVGDTLGENRSVAFLRIYSDLVPVNSLSPVTADPSATRLLEWKFDGSLNDSSGHGWTAAMSSGSPTYIATPYQNVIATIKTFNNPSWSNWTSLRAGFPAQLKGTDSFSQADASASVTCFWQSLSGPSTPTWSSRTSCTPTLTGLVFGGYNFQLVAKDINGASGTSTLQIGAVATDSNGVVITANPAAAIIYGPMIAFGKNPWALQDERALYATTTRSAYYTAQNLDPPVWAVPRAGTVAYQWFPWAASTTTLNGAITATATSIVVTDGTKINTTDFPTYVLIGGALGIGGEEIAICGKSGNTLTVCYDGRAQHVHNGTGTAWGNGTGVVQTKITGTGTAFLAPDSICPAGAGWPGPVLYNTGTITLTAGSTAATGTGTTWNTPVVAPSGQYATRAIRVSATHAGGTAFTFLAYITSTASDTAMVLDRAYPADADTGTFAFSILLPDVRNIVPHYTRSDGTDGALYLPSSECGSNTGVYVNNSFDLPIDNVTFSGKQYSYTDGFYGRDGGANYYDEGLAHYALYLRSGWQPALDAFHKLEGKDGTNNPGWLWYPDIAQGDASDAGRGRHASLTGAVVAAVLDGKASNWSGIRTYANSGVAAINQDCNYDTRENAYQLSWLALAALFDPVDTGNPADPNQRSYWKAQLANAYTRDNTCKTAGNSWIGTTFAKNTPPLIVTNGSRNVTGTGIDAATCATAGTATNVSVTHGSDLVTGVGFVRTFVRGLGTKVSINGGKIGGVPTFMSFDYILDSSTQIHLSGMYPGDTASGLTAYMDTDDYMLSFGTDATDPQLLKAWSCTWNNAGSITLDRAWDGPTGTVYGYRGNTSGKGQQPFVLGIKTLQMSLASKTVTGATATNYGALAVTAANWIRDFGYDPVTGGMYYYRLFGQCEPIYPTSSQPALFNYVNPGCSYSPEDISLKPIARALNGEAQNAYRVLYEAAPTPTNRDFGDKFYGSQWGATAFTQPGYYSDGITTGSIDNSAQYGLAGPKWTGFFFGIGMSHQWPAVRLGGPAAAVNRNIYVGYSLASVTNATVFQIVLTEPSGKTTTVACSGSPCTVPGDARQGAHLMTLQYLNAAAQVVAQSSQAIPLAVQ